MKLMVDLNVLLDVFQNRQPQYHFSSMVINKVLNKEITGYLPGHAITTIHYLTAKYADLDSADKIVDWMLEYFEVAPPNKVIFQNSRKLDMKDFEDAVVASLALSKSCDWIVTGNIKDFTNAPVKAILPKQLIEQLALW